MCGGFYQFESLFVLLTYQLITTHLLISTFQCFWLIKMEEGKESISCNLTAKKCNA